MMNRIAPWLCSRFAPMLLAVSVTWAVVAGPARAYDFTVGAMPLSVMGYVNQGVAFNIVGGDHYDTKKGFQSAIFQFLLETKLQMADNLTFFGSTMVNTDWAYPLLDGKSDEWGEKQFNRSRDRLYVFDDYQDLLKELHLTWTPGNFLFRIGKQIVKWGETDGIRLMDQINPSDTRRGLADVEFETTIIPIWLLRTEYFVQPQTTWLTDLGVEFVFNPNADFRGNELILPGNDVSGIWAPNISITHPALGFCHVGSYDIVKLDEPDAWDPDTFQYGVRLKGILADAIVTLNYFNGRDNQPIFESTRGRVPPEPSPWDGNLILHPGKKGHYPKLHFVGGTFSRDFPALRASVLGGVAPVLRTEVFYAFNSSFIYSPVIPPGEKELQKRDELRYALGLDWKFKVDWLNAKSYFSTSTQFFHRKIFDYPDDFYFSGVEDVNYTATFMINTSYFHNKLQPMFFWQRDITFRANLFKTQIAWEQSDRLKYKLGFLVFDGRRVAKGFQPFSNKDFVYFTVAYRFS